MTVTPFGMKTPIGLFVALALTAGLAACADDKPAPAPAPAPAPMAAPAPAPAPAPMPHMMGGKGRTEAIQSALNANGAKLTVDGHMGKKTHSALAAYQKSHGMKPTGRPDAKTLSALGV